MKKIVSMVLSLVLAIMLLAGCRGATDNTGDGGGPAGNENTGTVEETAAVKTGLAIATSAANSKDAGEKDGYSEVNSIIAAVTVDRNGRIVKCIMIRCRLQPIFPGKAGLPLT